MIVADANLLAYLLLTGERTDEAEGVFRKDPEWVVPALCLSELRSVALRYVRSDALTLADAHRVVSRAEALVEGRVADVESKRVVDLAHRSKCTTYDCEYVALAEVLNVPLVTADHRVLRAFPKRAVSPSAFVGR